MNYDGDGFRAHQQYRPAGGHEAEDAGEEVRDCEAADDEEDDHDDDEPEEEEEFEDPEHELEVYPEFPPPHGDHLRRSRMQIQSLFPIVVVKAGRISSGSSYYLPLMDMMKQNGSRFRVFSYSPRSRN